MAQWTLDLSLVAAGLGTDGSRVAAKSAGGCYVALRLDDTTVSVLSIDVDGAVVWKRDITLPAAGKPGNLIFTARGTNVAVGFNDALQTDVSFVALLNGTTGVIVWQKQLAFKLLAYWDEPIAKPIAINSAGDVIVAGTLNAASTTKYLVKFAAADGSVTWAINPLDDTSAATTRPVHQVEVTSTDDIVVGYSNGAGVSTVLKFGSAAGALVWSRRVAWPTSNAYAYVAVDPSDNVFVGSFKATTENEVYAVKLDSSGAEVWNKTLTTPPYKTVIGGALAADATNVYLGALFTDNFATYSRAGVYVIPTGGATAAAMAHVNADEAFGETANACSVAAGDLYFTSFDQVGFGSLRVLVNKVDPTSLGPLTVGPYTRVTVTPTLAAGTAVVTTMTPTFLADPVVTPAAGALTEGANTTLVATLYTASAVPPIIRFSHSLLPDNRFGLATLPRSFGTSAIQPTNQFGLPALDYNLETYATPVEPDNRFGGSQVYQYRPGGFVHRTESVLPAPQFGASVVLAGGARPASPVLPDPRFGLPLLRMQLAATTVSPANQFGLPAVRGAFQASSIAPAVQFGAAVLQGIYAASALAPDNRFGAATLTATGAYAASSIQPDPRFGLPSLMVRHLASPVYNRPRFGLARLVQAC